MELNFAPGVLEGGRINVELNIAVSSIDSFVTVTQAGFAVNGFPRRETTTTVEMRDGEGFAIAGLPQDDFRDLAGQVPWLDDIPVLGTLFRSTDHERERTELVFVVTAHLVSPARGEALATSPVPAFPTRRARSHAAASTRGGWRRSSPAPRHSRSSSRRSANGRTGPRRWRCRLRGGRGDRFNGKYARVIFREYVETAVPAPGLERRPDKSAFETGGSF